MPLKTLKNPAPLSKTQFVKLCQRAGGTSDTMLVQARADEQLSAMWIKIELADRVEKADPDLQEGLQALEALGYLPNGADAVMSSWPVH